MRDYLQLQITDNIKLEDLDFLDEIEFDQNKVVTGKNPSQHVSVGQEYPPDSTQPIDLLHFEVDQWNSRNGPNGESKLELNNPAENVSVGQEYLSDSTQPFDLLHFEVDQSNNLNGPNAESKLELDNPAENVSVNQEYPPDSTQPLDLLHFEVDQSNNLNGPNAESKLEVDNPAENVSVGQEFSDSTQPLDLLYFEIDQSKNLNGPNAEPKVEPNMELNTELFASLTLSDSDLNVSSRGFPPVHDQIPDTNLFVENTDSNIVYQTPDEINWSTPLNEPTDMNSINFYPQSYVQPNNFVQQQPPPVTQPDPSTYPELKFLQISNNNVLILCKKEDLAAAQPLATNSLVGPILHQTQGPMYIQNPIATQSNPGPTNFLMQNFTNPANYNPFQSIPRFFMTIPNQPTQRMGFNGANLPIAIKPKQIVPGAKFNPADSQPLYNFAAQQTAELLLTTSSKDILDELLEYKNKQPLHKPCSCTKSQCLKLYCECFVGSVFCQESCKCIKCFNNLEHHKERSEVLKSILARNPKAFDRKVVQLGNTHKVGCKCIRSNCLKNYCECYSANIPCTANCKCMQCKNRSNDDELDEDEPMEIADDVPEPNEGNTSNSSSNLDSQNEKKKPVELFDLLTEDVVDAVCDSMLLKGAACPGDDDDKLSTAMDEFSSCFDDIRAALERKIAKKDENGKRIKNIKKKFKKDQ